MSNGEKHTPKKLDNENIYRVTWIRDKDGYIRREGYSYGFNGFEILGLAYALLDDLRQQLLGHIKPDIQERTYVEDKKEVNNEE